MQQSINRLVDAYQEGLITKDEFETRLKKARIREASLANPRSALVIGVAAAELSVKHCISTLVPAAEWLATNLPTPPLVRILAEYFPKLPARCNFGGVVKSPPTKVLEALKKGVTIRNQLSHAGSTNPSGDVVEPILQAIEDLLWLVDFYSGFEWARDFLRDETRTALL